MVRRNLDAHFAARYRDLRFATARNLETYQAALALSRDCSHGATLLKRGFIRPVEPI